MHTTATPFTTLFAGVDRAPLTRGDAVRAAPGRAARLFAESRS
ncbi:hypothetical protein [Streptomyces sp. NPDC059452]